MILADVLVQCLLLSEALAAIFTAEPFLPFVDGLVSLESCASDEALAATFLGTDMLSFESVDGFDVLFQMLILDIILVTSLVLALEWSGIGVGVEVVS